CRLVLVSGKYMVLGMLLLLVPALLEPDALLALWLGTGRVPAGTALFTQLTVAWIAVYYLSIGYQMAAQGSEIYGAYALWVFGVGALTLGLAAGARPVGGLGAWVIPVIILGMTVVLAWGRAVLVGRAIDLPLREWTRRGISPVLVAVSVAVLGCLVVQHAMKPGAGRLVTICGVYPSLALP